jgi:hypothetical protein
MDDLEYVFVDTPGTVTLQHSLISNYSIDVNRPCSGSLFRCYGNVNDFVSFLRIANFVHYCKIYLKNCL